MVLWVIANHGLSLLRLRELRLAVLLLLIASPAWAQSEIDPVEPPQDSVEADEAELPQLIMDDADFGVEWPDFEAPALDEDSQLVEADEEPEGIEGDSDEQEVVQELDLPPAAEDDAAIADVRDEEGEAFSSEVAESIAEDIDSAVETGEVLSSAGREFGNFRLVLDYPDDNVAVRDRRAIQRRFDELSALEQADDDEDIGQLRRQAQKDRELLLQLLRVYGHYDGFVTSSVEVDPSGAADVLVVFSIQGGKRYALGDIDLGDLEQTGTDYPFLRQRFGVQSGDPLNSYAINSSRDNLAEALAENGYAFATLDPPELLIDHAAETGDLSLPVDPGRKYSFGNIIVGDDPLLSADHLSLIARFDKGDIFRQSRVLDLRRAILATGLASSVTIEPVATDRPAEQDDKDFTGPTPEPADADVDLAVDIVPAPLRTIGGELGFNTGEGLLAAATWEHRNFFPPEGMLRGRLIIGTQEQLLGATFRRNNFQARDRILTINALVQNVERDAFDARTLLFSGALERQTNLIFQKTWAWSMGLELILTDERDSVDAIDGTGRRTFAIAALPLILAYDDSDDLLDPTTGFRLSGFVSPEISFQSGTFGYARTQIDGSYYQPLSDNVTLAGRVRFGSIAGASALDIAPSRRLYAGGGGSVRGYGFQDIGPLNVNGDPIGGRSLAEFSLEARIRFGAFGVVPFVDAGNVYNDALPTFGGMQYGAGIGLRYYSSFGPLRLDVGTPINPRPGDATIGVYISLGQAF